MGEEKTNQPGSAAPLHQRLNALADHIAPVDPAAAARLRKLSTALTDSDAAVQWAFADLRRAFDARSLAARCAVRTADNTQLSNWEAVRNALIFVPLILTWLGILDAANGFYQLARVDPVAAQQPFLYLWQDAFGGRSVFTLGNIALVDVGILSGVAILTAVLMRQAGQGAARERAAAARIELDLVSALFEADLALAEHRLPQPYASITRLEHMAELLHGRMEQEGGRIAALAGEKERQLAALTAFTPQLAAGAATLLAAAERLEQGQAGLAQTIGSLKAPLAELAQRQAELSAATRETRQQLQAYHTHQQAIAQGLAELNRHQTELVGEAQAQLAALSSTVSQAAPAFDGFSQAAGDLAHSQTQLLHQLAAERGEQARMAQAIAQAGGSLQASAQQFVQATNDNAARNATQFANLAAELGRASHALTDAAAAARSALQPARR